MSKGGKRRGWRYYRNLYNAHTRELAQLAAAHQPEPPPTTPRPDSPLVRRRPRRVVTPQPTRTMTEREAAIREWYLYGGADDLPPDGLTEDELWNVRSRFCK